MHPKPFDLSTCQFGFRFGPGAVSATLLSIDDMPDRLLPLCQSRYGGIGAVGGR